MYDCMRAMTKKMLLAWRTNTCVHITVFQICITNNIIYVFYSYWFWYYCDRFGHLVSLGRRKIHNAKYLCDIMIYDSINALKIWFSLNIICGFRSIICIFIWMGWFVIFLIRPSAMQHTSCQRLKGKNAQKYLSLVVWQNRDIVFYTYLYG